MLMHVVLKVITFAKLSVKSDACSGMNRDVLMGTQNLDDILVAIKEVTGSDT